MRIYHVVALVLLPSIATCQLLSSPILRSSRTLPGESAFGQGNGIVENSNNVVMTTSDGKLFIVTLNELLSRNGTLEEDDEMLVYNPTTESSNPTITCNSRPAFVETNTTSFAIYSVIESISPSEYQSRLIAVKLDDASMLWSITIPGRTTGTPLVSTNYRHIYIIHNVYDSNQGSDDGRISVITIESNRQASIAFTFPSQFSGAPFAPGSLQSYSTQSSETDQGASESTELIDFVFFGQRVEDGYSRRGSLYSLVVRGEITLGMIEALPAQLRLVSDLPGSGKTPPAVSESLEVYLGTEQSYLFGYTDSNGFSALVQDSASIDTDNDDDQEARGPTDIIPYRRGNQVPQWIVPLAQNATDDKAPIPGTPILSPDGLFVYVAAAGNEIVCIARTAGENPDVTWAYVTTGAHISTPIYQTLPGRGETSIYFIEQNTGVVRQFDPLQGTLLWETEGSIAVEADATLVSNNTILIYGDVNGRLYALSVAEGKLPIDVIKPTRSPSKAPKRTEKTPAPTVRKRVNATAGPTDLPTVQPSSNDTLPNINQNGTKDTNITNPDTASISIGNERKSLSFNSVVEDYLPYIVGGASGIILVCILFVFCLRRRQTKNRKIIFLTDLETQREEEDSARNFEITRMKVEKECEDEERETLDAIISSTSPIRGKGDIATPDTSLNTSAETSNSKANAGPDTSDIDGIYSTPQIGFEISQDDFSVTESMNDMSETPMEYSPSIYSPKAQPIPHSIMRIVPQIPFDVPDHLSSGAMSPKRQNLPDTSLAVPSLLPPMISATPSQDEIDVLAHSVSSDPSRSKTKNSDKTESLMWKVAAALSLPLTEIARQNETSATSRVADISKKEPLDSGDVDDDSDMEGFSNFMSELVTPQQSLHKRDTKSTMIDSSLILDSPLPVVPPITKDILRGTKATQRKGAVSPFHDDSNSVDDSLYVDEGGIEIPTDEADIGAGAAVLDESPEAGQKVYDDKMEELDDEPPLILRPGSQYRERHTPIKDGQAMDSTPAEIRRFLDSNMLKPTYKGVSVRPSRAKAGLFSRRIGGAARPSDSDEDVAERNTNSQPTQLAKAQNVPLPTQRRKDRIVAEPHFEPSPASYYVEETEVAINKGVDTKTEWNSFLQELSDVENDFYCPVSPSRNHDNVETQQPIQPNRYSNSLLTPDIGNTPYDDDSDTSSEHEAPPPPRTFYA